MDALVKRKAAGPGSRGSGILRRLVVLRFGPEYAPLFDRLYSGDTPPRTTHPNPDPPDLGHPNAAHPNAAHPNAAHPNAAHPGAGHPGAGHPEVGYPGAGDPEVGYPNAGHPEAGYPSAGHPGAGHPEAGYPEFGYPNVGQPGAGYPPSRHPDFGQRPVAGTDGDISTTEMLEMRSFLNSVFTDPDYADEEPRRLEMWLDPTFPREPSRYMIWDYARVMLLLRCGHMADWLPEEFCWDRLFELAMDVQRHYTSWHDMATCYLQGRLMWSGGTAGRQGRFEQCQSPRRRPGQPVEPRPLAPAAAARLALTFNRVVKR